MGPARCVMYKQLSTGTNCLDGMQKHKHAHDCPSYGSSHKAVTTCAVARHHDSPSRWYIRMYSVTVELTAQCADSTVCRHQSMHAQHPFSNPLAACQSNPTNYNTHSETTTCVTANTLLGSLAQCCPLQAPTPQHPDCVSAKDQHCVNMKR